MHHFQMWSYNSPFHVSIDSIKTTSISSFIHHDFKTVSFYRNKDFGNVTLKDYYIKIKE